ncbi:ABC transporter substrate-binding protein [uncultured Cocleimonas sp.]|uniref:substrate-binding periplasmic protein n=1 Tax=uncultured Cocleimonas sp. TaxID=1051587 RepID=UPI00261F1377|nr:transporter substrate-binding domain-containing protein [uncultured Cocleimonas sp.]
MNISSLVGYRVLCTFTAILVMCSGFITTQTVNAQSLTFGFGDTQTPPRKWKVDGEYLGVYFDVIDEVMARSKIKIDVNPYPHERLLQYLENGVIDGAIGLYKTPEREKYATYVDIPIAWSEMRIFIKKGQQFQIKNINNFSGKIIGKIRGVSINKEFDDAVERGEFSVEETRSYTQSIKKLMIERIDVLIAPEMSTQHLLKEMNLLDEVEMLPFHFKRIRPVFILFSKAADTPEKKAMFEKIREVLIEMEIEKKFQDILLKYSVVSAP